MALNANNLVVGNGGTVYWGTSNITMPTSYSSTLTGFNDLGYLDEDGVTVSVTPVIQELPVWQSKSPGRRALQNQNIAVSGKFGEWNSHTVPRAFGGGTLASLTGGTYAFPTDTAALEEFASVSDVIDGSDVHRFSFARVNQTEAAEVTFNRQSLAVLPFHFGVLAPTAGGSPGSYFVQST